MKIYNQLIQRIRLTKKYRDWRQAVIDKDGMNFKSMNIHHKKPLKQILIDNDITTLEEALACEEIWDVENGVVIKKGEHLILSWLEKLKYPTHNFVNIVDEWIKEKMSEW